MAPSWAVKPQPTVAASAIPATRVRSPAGAEVRRDEPDSAAVPSWLRAAYPDNPTGPGEEGHAAGITPTVPPMTASAPTRG